MRTLTSHFDHIIIVIQEFNNLETFKLEDLVGLLEAHEMRNVETKGVQNSIQALQAQIWKKHGGSNNFKGKRDKTQSKKYWSNPQKHKIDYRTSESSKRGQGNSYQKDKEKKDVQCYNCEKWGHLTKNCWYNKDMVVMTAIVDADVYSKILSIYSGCSNHMTGQKVWLADFDSSKKSKVKLANNSSLQAECNSDILVDENFPFSTYVS
ncbi:uncharacterized protein LOC127080692 [Lathyrus oleraceus]|uniref:uncharacterized protein LOC127080692 n=1 Tax=Pisum sativum TaxID=3888 RepID=UPI0021D22F4A|nr:uncharacterized protein LOC127080692 [Pisum sativum]